MEAVARQLHGLNFEFFYGTDKDSLDMEQAKTQGLYSQEGYEKYYKKPSTISKGMLSCALGHVKIYEDIVQNGYQRTLILEDDAIPVTSALHLFPFLTASLPQDWELLYLGYEKNELNGFAQKLKRMAYMTWPSHAKLKLSRKIYSHYYPDTLSENIARAGFHDCTHAYAVTLGAAKKLLPMQTPVVLNPDNLLAFACTTDIIKGYIVRPKLFKQLSAFEGSLASLTGD